MSNLTSPFCYFASPDINDLHLVSHKFHRSIEGFPNLVIQFDENFLHASRIFLTLFELTDKENLRFSGQAGNLFSNFINLYKNLNSNKKF